MEKLEADFRSCFVEWLWRKQELNRRTLRQVLSRFASLEEFKKSRNEELTALWGESSAFKKILALKHSLVAHASTFPFLTYLDPAFPPALCSLADPPCVLYFRGQLNRMTAPSLRIGLVGTREASRYGLQMCRQIVLEMRPFGPTIVSGMALGIDACAHRSALEAGLASIGILGTPIDCDYPAEHPALFRAMEASGLLLSELPPGAPMARWRFLERNRLIAALSDVLIVVEAPEKSGALATAREALELGKEIYVVPGRFDMPANLGGHRLIQEGANLLMAVSDIFKGREGESSHFVADSMVMSSKLPSLDPSSKSYRILSLFQEGVLHVDKVTELSELPASQVSGILMNLVLSGYLRELPGGFFERLSGLER